MRAALPPRAALLFFQGRAPLRMVLRRLPLGGNNSGVNLTMVLSALQAAVGAALVGRPDTASRLVASPYPGGAAPPPEVVRVLGSRMIAQAGVVTATARRHPRHLRAVLRAGVGVDVLHAASMVVVAAWKPEYRRGALVSAVTATASAGAGWWASRGVQR